MAETPAYLQSNDAKHALGANRGPMPAHDVDDADAESAYDHLEDGKGLSLEKTQTTASQKVVKHWKRFWCCYLVGNIIFLAIFLPIFFLICIPAIAQRVVDNSNLKLLSAQIMEPRPDSVLMSIKSSIKLPIALPVRINPLTLDLLVRDLPGNNTYAKVYIPESTIKTKATLGEDKQPTPLNVPVWSHYVNQVMFQKKVPLSVHGRTLQHLGELHSMITMDKDIQLQGLGGFPDFKIEDTGLHLPPKPDGTNLVANASLPNPSPFILEVGDKVMFDVKSGDLVLGNATIENLVLQQGNHTYPINGILDIPFMLKNLGTIVKQQASAIRQGNLELKTVGKSVSYKGQTVKYYEDPLKKLVLPATVPIMGLLVNTLHGMLDKNGTNVLAGAANSNANDNASDNLSGLVNSISNSNSGGSGGGLLGALTGDKGSSGGSDSSSGSTSNSGSGSSSDSSSGDSNSFLDALRDAKNGNNGDNGKRDLSDLVDKDENPQDLLNELISRISRGDDPEGIFSDGLRRLSKFL